MDRFESPRPTPHADAIRATLPGVSFIGGLDGIDRSAEIGFKRHLLLPGLLITAGEVLLVGFPLWSLFELGVVDSSTLWRVAIPVLAGASLVWLAIVAASLAPLQRAVQVHRRGHRLPTDLATSAYHATIRVPLRVLFVRTLLWVFTGLVVGAFLVQYTGWPWSKVAQIASLAGLHGFAVSLLRALWYAAILEAIRVQLFPDRNRLQHFADAYFGRLVLVALVVWGGAAVAMAGFLFYLLPINLEQYLAMQTYFPVALTLAMVLWVIAARRMARGLEGYFQAKLDGGPEPTSRSSSRARYRTGKQSGKKASKGGDGEPSAILVYRRAQSLPYRLAMAGLALWTLVMAGAVAVARARLRFELDDTIVMVGMALLMAVGAAIYQSLWHRESMRSLLAHLTIRHRLPVRAIRPFLSLRGKLLLSFGGMVFFSCGMALFWGFLQYKNLATESMSRQAELGLELVRSEVQAAVAAHDEPPSPAVVETALKHIDERGASAGAFIYHLAPGDRIARPVGLSFPSDGPDGATAIAVGRSAATPRLPWYAVGLMDLPRDGPIDLSASLELTGRHGRLQVTWHGESHELGAVAVLYPYYRSSDEATARPLKELLVFFLLLFGASGGIVTLTVGQFVKPIRKLERRADGMARGELAEPVSSGGEGDEIGRLTFALEEMRRALREKLRSTEEVNLDLERAVQRRTADLAKKNRELAETLDKLTRTQDQLVRAEKMASIGQLVAGIAHEINNPVNAIVNTVGPLDEAIQMISSDDEEERDEAASDVHDMVRVIQRGAQRTKDIVRALHNYSRTDDERVSDFELNRSLEDSLELLRHLLKQNITVERDYGEVGQIRGHAGKLNQVFMNLLTNAAQALSGRDGAIIRIHTHRQDDNVVIRIEDNGGGIPSDVLPRIFDPFFTTKDVGAGAGLGLSIVHGIVERHGGTIEVDSEVAKGTVFTVRLPSDPEHSLDATPAELRAEVSGRSTRGDSRT